MTREKSPTLLPDASCLQLVRLQADEQFLLAIVATTSSGADGPLCQSHSQSIHSRYVRVVADLPWAGWAVRLELHVRRFFCQNEECKRQIFTERLPGVVAPYARRTARLADLLTLIGFALGGEAGSSLVERMGLESAPETLLRLIRQQQEQPVPTPRVLGVDDFSFCRRKSYGAILIDLERRVPIDLLPDRSVETVSAWFVAHPSVEIVSRDRSSEYAAAIKKGAPQALEVADRWHMGKNLAESVKTLLAGSRAELRRAWQGETLPEQERAETEPVLEEEKRPARSRGEEQARLARRAQKLDRYQQVLELREQGLTAAAIGARIGISGRTVQRWLAHGSWTFARHRRRRPSLIDPYEQYVREWWQAGNRNGLQLYRALTAQGSKGSSTAMYRYLARLRAPQRSSVEVTPSKPQRRTSILASPSPLENFSAQRATWLFVCPPDELNETQHNELALIRQASPNAEAAYHLAQAFMQMIRARTGHQLDAWLSEAEASHLPEFKSFAKGIQHDKAAVLAGLTLPWSNGPLEGHVNRLKLIKRSMYGRAKLPLLRARVLHVDGSAEPSHAALRAAG